jgi:hypothetical protein
MKKLALIVILILFVSLFLGADVYTKSLERVKAFELMGKKQQEKLQMKDRWYGKNKYAEIGEDFITTIIDLDKEMMYFALHDPKIYFEIPIDLVGNRLFEFITSLSPKVAEAVKSIRITDAKVNLRNENKKIANWDCTASEFEMVIIIPALNMMPKFKMKMWMTHDLPKDYEKFFEMGEYFIQSMIGMLNIDENSQKEMAKMESIDGFQVAANITVEIFGTKIEVESQTLEVSEKPAPPGTYDIPKGYVKKDISFIKEKIKQMPKANASH